MEEIVCLIEPKPEEPIPELSVRKNNFFNDDSSVSSSAPSTITYFNRDGNVSRDRTKTSE